MLSSLVTVYIWFVFIIVFVDFALSNIRQGKNKHNCHIMDLLPQLFYSLSVICCCGKCFGCLHCLAPIFFAYFTGRCVCVCICVRVGAATNRNSCRKSLHLLQLADFVAASPCFVKQLLVIVVKSSFALTCMCVCARKSCCQTHLFLTHLFHAYRSLSLSLSLSRSLTALVSVCICL